MIFVQFSKGTLEFEPEEVELALGRFLRFFDACVATNK